MHLADNTLRRAEMRHPMIRKNIDTSEIIKSVKEMIESLDLGTDRRFFYSITEEGNGLRFTLSVL